MDIDERIRVSAEKCQALELDDTGPSTFSRTWTYAEVARILRVSVRTLLRGLAAGRLPPPVRMGASTRFPEGWVARVLTEGWAAPGTHQPTIGQRSAEQQARGTVQVPAVVVIAGKTSRQVRGQRVKIADERRATIKKRDKKAQKPTKAEVKKTAPKPKRKGAPKR